MHWRAYSGGGPSRDAVDGVGGADFAHHAGGGFFGVGSVGGEEFAGSADEVLFLEVGGAGMVHDVSKVDGVGAGVDEGSIVILIFGMWRDHVIVDVVHSAALLAQYAGWRNWMHWRRRRRWSRHTSSARRMVYNVVVHTQDLHPPGQGFVSSLLLPATF